MCIRDSDNGGRVIVYKFNDDDEQWEPMGQEINGEALSDYSGCSVSLSSDGNRVAIGAIYNDDNGFRSGHVRVYEFNGT